MASIDVENEPGHPGRPSAAKASMEKQKSVQPGIKAISEDDEHLAHLANQEDHQLTPLGEAKKHPRQVLPFGGDHVLDGNWQSAINGGPNASVAIGSLLSAFFADLIGRKWMVLIGCLIGYAGITLEVTATTIAMFFTGKLINGFAIGIYTNISVTIIGEV
ncbi:hypothetical protein ACHAPT_010868 [Fusarium lateritium]